MLCRIEAIGRVVREPELKKCSNGKHMLKFTIKTFDMGANWINVQIFREKAAEYYAENLKVGDTIYIHGRYVTRNFQTDDGVKQRYHSVVLAFDGIMKHLDPNKDFSDQDDKEGVSLDDGDDVSEDPSLEDEIPF